MARQVAEVYENPFSPAAIATQETKRFSNPKAVEAHSKEITRLGNDGFVVLEDVFLTDELDEIREIFARWHRDEALCDTEFAGLKTQRLYNLVARTRAFDKLFLNEKVLAIIEGHLKDQIQLSIASSVNLLPGETAQPFHRDDGYYPIERPHMPLSVNTMWAIDDFTLANGATQLIPGSHLISDAEPPARMKTEQAQMKAGSVLLWDGSLFHGGGANQTDQARLGVTVVYCRAWLRQQENQFLGVPPEVAKDLPRPLQKLIGYWVVNNLLGYVNDASPSRFLE
ncbi:MAG: phytanoyl-CoA dioxygenase family protein [Pseudomonadota bacterium]